MILTRQFKPQLKKGLTQFHLQTLTMQMGIIANKYNKLDKALLLLLMPIMYNCLQYYRFIKANDERRETFRF